MSLIQEDNNDELKDVIIHPVSSRSVPMPIRHLKVAATARTRSSTPVIDTLRSLRSQPELQKKVYDNTWSSCCITVDKRALQYFTQMAVLSVVLGFSMTQLVRIDSCEGQNLYYGLLVLVLGFMNGLTVSSRDRKNNDSN
jgi:hypothetical protein